MARGFDSKFVEAQQEEASRAKVIRPALTPEEKEEASRREALQLSRARVLDDLSRASAPAHRQMLERAISAIDAQLADLTRE